jgi:hypothetical protein
MIRTVIIMSVVCSLVSGCIALPPALMYLSYAKSGLDLISMISTEKTLTDHALSYAMDEDCNLMRVLSLDDICAPLAFANADVIVLPGEERARVSLPAASFGEDGRLLLRRTLGTRLQSRPIVVAALSENELAGVGSDIGQRPVSEMRFRVVKSRNEEPTAVPASFDEGFVRLVN